jgi:hypothetical protein
MSPIEQALRAYFDLTEPLLKKFVWTADKAGEVAAITNAARAALSALEAPQPVEPNYSELSREALERHAVRMAQAMATAHAFWSKHALGPLAAPSCLCCGKLPNEVAIRHMELPGVVICTVCRDKALGVSEAAPAGWIPVTDHFPPYSEEDEFLCFSESHTFGGNEHFCTLKGSDFYEFDPDESDNPGTPTSKCITHWMPLPWPPSLCRTAAPSAPTPSPDSEPPSWLMCITAWLRGLPARDATHFSGAQFSDDCESAALALEEHALFSERTA